MERMVTEYYPEHFDLIDNQDPIQIARQVVDELRKRKEDGGTLKSVLGYDLLAEINFEKLGTALGQLWGEKWSDYKYEMSSLVGPKGTPEVWRGCKVTIRTAKTQDPRVSKLVAAVLEVPGNPVRIVYDDPQIKMVGIEEATQKQIRQIIKYVKPFKSKISERVRPGNPNFKIKPEYDRLWERIQSGEKQTSVIEEFLDENPDATEAAVRQAIYRRKIPQNKRNS